MPVGSILTVKEQASTVQPLLLATITFHDSSVLRLSTHDITGGVLYGGNSYLPRIVNKEIAASQALSENGIDIPASVNLRLSDADYLWSNFEKLKGFKGAKLELRAVAYDVVAQEFSSDSRVIFRGICKEPGGRLPNHDGKILTVAFFSRLGMADNGEGRPGTSPARVGGDDGRGVHERDSRLRAGSGRGTGQGFVSSGGSKFSGELNTSVHNFPRGD